MGGSDVDGGRPATGGGGSSGVAPQGGEAGVVSVGNGGAGGEAPRCDVSQVTASLGLDTWIDSARRKVSSPDDVALSVVRAPDERRALLQLELPAVDGAAELVGASLTLHLESNADVAAGARQLAVHLLELPIDAKASWVNATKNTKWTTEGGDFAAELASLTLPPGSTDATLTFDVTALLRSSLTAAPVTVGLVVLEIGAAPPPPAELAFTSSEGDASKSPRLVLTYCQP